MYAGLSIEKYKEFQWNELVLESNELCSKNAAIIDEIRQAGIQSTVFAEAVMNWIKKVGEFSPSSASEHSFLENASFANNYLKLLACVEYIPEFGDYLDTCKEKSHLILRKLKEGDSIASNTPRLFEDLIDILEIVLACQIANVEGNIIANVGASRFQHSILLTNLCDTASSMVDSISNSKKVYQTFSMKLLLPCTRLLDYSNYLPEVSLSLITKLIGKCLFHEQKEVEDITTVNFSSIKEGTTKESNIVLHSKAAPHPTLSYTASVFTVLSEYCKTMDSKLQAFVEVFAEKDCLLFNNCFGFAKFLTAYANSSNGCIITGRSSTMHGLSTNAHKRKQYTESTTSASDSFSWRKHCQRVLHVGFELIAIVENEFIAPIDHEWSTNAADDAILIGMKYILGLNMRNSILQALNQLLPGSISQHQSLVVYIEKMKSLSRMCMNTISINSSVHIPQITKLLQRKSRMIQVGNVNMEDIQISQRQRHVIVIGKLSSMAATGLLQCLQVLMQIDHRAVLESFDVLVEETAHQSPKASKRQKKASAAGAETVSIENPELTTTTKEAGASVVSQGNNWSEISTKRLVQVLVECMYLENRINSKFCESIGSSGQHIGTAEGTVDDSIVDQLKCELEQLNTSRLNLLQQLLDVYSDLRRLDILMQVFVSTRMNSSVSLSSIQAWIQRMLSSPSQTIKLTSSCNDFNYSGLGELLADVRIQTKLSRVVMSLSSSQMLSVWKSLAMITPSTTTSDFKDDAESISKSIGDSSLKHAPATPSSSSSCAVIHPCASILIHSVVSAMFLSPDVNVASIDFQIVAKILSQVAQILEQSLSFDNLFTSCAAVTDDANDEDPSVLLSLLQAIEVVSSIAQLMAAACSRYQVDIVPLSDVASTEPLAATGEHGFISTILNHFCKIAQHLIQFSGSNSAVDTVASLHVWNRLRFSCCACNVVLLSAFMNADAAGMRSWVGGSSSNSWEETQALLREAMITLLPSRDQIESINYKILNGVGDEVMDRMSSWQSLELIVKILSLSSCELPINMDAELISKTFFLLLNCNLRSSSITAAAANEKKSTQLSRNLFGCNRNSHALIHSSEVLNHFILCEALLQAMMMQLQECDMQLQKYYSCCNHPLGTQPRTGAFSPQSKKKKQKIITPSSPVEIRDHVLELAKLEDTYRCYSQLFTLYPHILPLSELLSNTAGNENQMVFMKNYIMCLYSICSTSCAIAQASSLASNENKLLAQEYVDGSCELLRIALLHLWQQNQVIFRENEKEITKSLLRELHQLIPGILAATASAAAAAAAAAVDVNAGVTVADELATYCCSHHDATSELPRTKLITMLCDLLLMHAATLADDTIEMEYVNNCMANVIDPCVDHMILFANSIHHPVIEGMHPRYVSFCLHLIVSVANTAIALQSSTSAEKTYNRGVLEKLLGRFSELIQNIIAALVNSENDEYEIAIYEDRVGTLQLLAASSLRVLGGLGVEVSDDDRTIVDRGHQLCGQSIVELLQQLMTGGLQSSFLTNHKVDVSLPVAEHKMRCQLHLLGTCLVLNASWFNPLRLNGGSFDSLASGILTCLDVLSNSIGNIDSLLHLESIQICFRGIVAAVSMEHPQLLLNFFLRMNNNANLMLAPKEQLHNNCFLLRKSCYGSFALQFVEALLFACQLSTKDRHRAESQASMQMFMMQLSRQVLDSYCSNFIPVVCPTKSLLGSEHQHVSLLRTLSLGFQIIRKFSFKRDGNVAGLSEKELVSQWSTVSLNSLSSVSNMLIAGHSHSELILPHILNVLELTVSQSKFECIGTSVGSVALTLRSVLYLMLTLPKSKSPAKLDIENKCFQSLSRALSMAASNFELMKHAHLLVASIIDFLSKQDLSHLQSTSMTFISNGVFALLDRCKQAQKKQLFGHLDSQGKILFEEFNSNYVRDFKFAGKA